MSWLGKLLGTQSTTYQNNAKNEIERVVIVNGEVVDEDTTGNTNAWTDAAWAWFNSRNHNQTVGGNKWEKQSQNTEYHDGHGHVYDFKSQEWTYENTGRTVGQYDMPTYDPNNNGYWDGVG
jgi:hypothetical protein